MQPRYSGGKVGDEVLTSITGFFFLSGMCIVVLSMGPTLAGLDFMTALSSAATSLSNVGPRAWLDRWPVRHVSRPAGRREMDAFRGDAGAAALNLHCCRTL
jgi:hypothetical protein